MRWGFFEDGAFDFDMAAPQGGRSMKRGFQVGGYFPQEVYEESLIIDSGGGSCSNSPLTGGLCAEGGGDEALLLRDDKPDLRSRRGERVDVRIRGIAEGEARQQLVVLGNVEFGVHGAAPERQEAQRA